MGDLNNEIPSWRNYRLEDETEVKHSNSKIIAWRSVYEEYDKKNDRWVEKKDFTCHLYLNKSKHKVLNLGGCNDGSRFTSVNQAINQAKVFIDYVGD